MVIEMGGEEFNRENLRFFRGERQLVPDPAGAASPIAARTQARSSTSPTAPRGSGSWPQERHAGNTHYLGNADAPSGYWACASAGSGSWCVFGSKLGRILQEATRTASSGLGWGSCRGFTVEEMERIDFEAVDLSEFTEDLVTDGS